ncbi:MAG: DNA-processing protein DprA, partial [Spirochaetaceae bacterium]|nr:DNA-processing protein DprA [Spirochaetaceae bacterium]
AVLACGVESIYPASHRRLGRIILEKGGCILSEYPPGWLPLKWCFPARNRIISGLSSVITVIEAPRGSGALITADFAIEQGRELVFHECCTKQPGQELTQTKKMDINQYINDGAPVISSADEILAVIQH